MSDVAFAQDTNFGLYGFLLLEQYTANFEIPYSREHRALHKYPSFIIFNISHPDRPSESDLFGNTLFLKVAGGIIVGVGQKMHHT